QSQHRVEPPCNVFYKCGGCQIQHMSYDMQLEMKQNQVKNVMKKIAHLPDQLLLLYHPYTPLHWCLQYQSHLPQVRKQHFHHQGNPLLELDTFIWRSPDCKGESE